MKTEKNLEYMKKLKEIGLRQESKEYILTFKHLHEIERLSSLHGELYSFKYQEYCDNINNIITDNMRQIYSNYNTDELLDVLEKYIYKIEKHKMKNRYSYIFIIFLGYYENSVIRKEITVQSKSIRECAIKAIIELNKRGIK